MYVCVYIYERESVSQSCPTLCNPVDCSPPGSSVHGTLQARILEWVATSFSNYIHTHKIKGFPGGSVKNPTANAGDVDSIPEFDP